MIGYQQANENFNNLPEKSTKMTDPPKGKAQRKPFTKNEIKEHIKTQRPLYQRQNLIPKCPTG
jgi:hypothetical protein